MNMHHTESNLIEINNKIKNKINSLSLDQYNPKVIAVSKTFKEARYFAFIRLWPL